MPEASWRWLGHFAVRIDAGPQRIYVDPYQLKSDKCPPATAVLVTNPKVGHCSPEDVALIAREDTVVAGPADAMSLLSGERRELGAGDEIHLPGVRIRAVPAYNVRLRFFPRERGWLGYVIEAGGTTFYHAGATDRVDDMRAISADVAFLPVSGRYLMGPDEARSAADDVGARVRVALSLAGDRYRALEGFSTREREG